MRLSYISLMCASWLTACSMNHPSIVDNSDPNALPPVPLIPNSSVQVSPTQAISFEKLVYWAGYIGVAYMVLDPFSPNWDIQEARMPENHVHFQLSMKRYYSGGAGEARVVFHRRAKELMRAGGYASYEVVEFNEGMESSVLGSKRSAEGVIRFLKNPA